MRKDLIDYGYLWIGMQEISYDVALQISSTKSVYLLYEDDSESMAYNLQEIREHYNKGGKFGVEIESYDEYVVFILGRDMLKGILPLENDIAFEWCVNIAKDFEISEFNVNTKGLWTCVEDYIKARFYINENGEISFMGKDLYECCGGER